MLSNDLYLGETGIENLLPMGGRKYHEGWVDGLTRTERTASGRKVQDIIAKKKRFVVEYSLIDDSELQTITDLFDLDSPLEFTIRRISGVVDKYNVILMPFDQTRILSVGSGLWGDVVLEMEEI